METCGRSTHRDRAPLQERTARRPAGSASRVGIVRPRSPAIARWRPPWEALHAARCRMLRRQTAAAIVRLRLRAAAIVRGRWEQHRSNAVRCNLRQPTIVADSVRSRLRAIGPRLRQAWERPRSVVLSSRRRQRIAAPTGQLILLRGARWAARTRTGEAAATTGIGRRRAMVANRGATAVLRTRAAMGVVHLPVHNSICASR